MRVGFGFDTHKLEKGTSIRLGGIDIPSTYSIVAHSDGDIIYHACADAIYGALAIGDIGEHFPDTKESNRDIDSSIILAHAIEKTKSMKFCVNNIDITIVLESPKISEYKKDIIRNLAQILKIDIKNINLKASTSEKLGFIGKNLGLTCYSIVSLLEKKL